PRCPARRKSPWPRPGSHPCYGSRRLAVWAAALRASTHARGPPPGHGAIWRRNSGSVTLEIVEAVLQIAGATRRSLAWLCAVAGLLADNWWMLVPFKHGLMRSPNELFSNLEVTGQPYAMLMQRADVTAGVLLLLAFVVAGSRTLPGARREWLGMVVFAMAGAI